VNSHQFSRFICNEVVRRFRQLLIALINFHSARCAVVQMFLFSTSMKLTVGTGTGHAVIAAVLYDVSR
jgi:hypothetical protein